MSTNQNAEQMAAIYMNRMQFQAASLIGNASVFTLGEMQIAYTGLAADAEIAVNLDRSHGKTGKQQPALINELIIKVLVKQLTECDPKLLNASAVNLNEFLQTNALLKLAVKEALKPFTNKDNMFEALKKSETKSALESILNG
jgi:hypothetical protein